MAFSDSIDSFYQEVKARILTKNANRRVLGLLDAQDWPHGPVQTEAFYLLSLNAQPPGVQTGTIANPQLSRLVQWVWIVKGADLVQGQRARNRGNRFRVNEQMMDELIHGLYPYFAEKKSWATDGNGAWAGTTKTPKEFIQWTRPQFTKRLDKDSGLVYGAASVNVTDMLDQITG